MVMLVLFCDEHQQRWCMLKLILPSVQPGEITVLLLCRAYEAIQDLRCNMDCFIARAAPALINIRKSVISYPVYGQ